MIIMRKNLSVENMKNENGQIKIYERNKYSKGIPNSVASMFPRFRQNAIRNSPDCNLIWLKKKCHTNNKQ